MTGGDSNEGASEEMPPPNTGGASASSTRVNPAVYLRSLFRNLSPRFPRTPAAGGDEATSSLPITQPRASPTVIPVSPRHVRSLQLLHRANSSESIPSVSSFLPRIMYEAFSEVIPSGILVPPRSPTSSPVLPTALSEVMDIPSGGVDVPSRSPTSSPFLPRTLYEALSEVIPSGIVVRSRSPTSSLVSPRTLHATVSEFIPSSGSSQAAGDEMPPSNTVIVSDVDVRLRPNADVVGDDEMLPPNTGGVSEAGWRRLNTGGVIYDDRMLRRRHSEAATGVQSFTQTLTPIPLPDSTVTSEAGSSGSEYLTPSDAGSFKSVGSSLSLFNTYEVGSTSAPPTAPLFSDQNNTPPPTGPNQNPQELNYRMLISEVWKYLNAWFFDLPVPEPTHLNSLLGREQIRGIFQAVTGGLMTVQRLAGNHWISRFVSYSYFVFALSGVLLSATRPGSGMWLLLSIMRLISFVTTFSGVIWIIVTCQLNV